MGCDIHLHIEVKMEDKWRHYSNPNIERNYKLFALLADVRNYDDIQPISKPKGLPEDITYLTHKDYGNWGTEVHDTSWLSIEELIELEQKKPELNMVKEPFFYYKLFNNFLFGSSLVGWYKYPQDNNYGIEDLRIVFWFDN